MTKKQIAISKFLAYVLRHNPQEAGITLDGDGYADVSHLLGRLNLTQEELDYLVDNNSKKRFQYNDDKTKLRANRGHSKELGLSIKLEKVTPEDRIYHGTAERVKDNILNEGILSMSRTYVHLSSEMAEAVEVAKRHSKDIVVFEVDASAMVNDGYEFQLSSDKMYLIEEVPSKYLKVIEL